MNLSMEHEVIEEGAIIALGDVINTNMPGLYTSQNIAPWHPDDNRASPTRAQNISLFFVRSSFASQRSINAAALLPITSNNNINEVQIEMVDEESGNWIDDFPERRRVNKPPKLSRRKLNETLLVIASQGGLGLFATSYSSHLSPRGVILLHSAVACNVIGFLCCLYSLLLNGHKPGVARILTGAGCATTVYGFLSIMGMILVDHLMLWMVAVACIASFPAIAVFLKKKDLQNLFW